MSITIGNYTFEGPYPSTDSLHDKSGVYAVLTRATATDLYSVVDIGESGGIRSRVANHDRAPCWNGRKQAQGLFAAALYCDERTRMNVEKQLRAQYNPPCGDR